MLIKDLLNIYEDVSMNDKKLILSYVLKMKTLDLVLHGNKEIGRFNRLKYKFFIKRLRSGISLQYIVKSANFYGLEFYVNKYVLIPRPETEFLTKNTSDLIFKYFNNKKVSVLDLGTGSGCIAITLKSLNPKLNVSASDISVKALRVAKKNARRHHSNIKFIRSDVFKKINESFDVIISNPPYIDKDDPNVEDIVKNNEPHQAIYAKDKGLYFYKEILKNAKKAKIFAFEIGSNQKEAILGIINVYYPNAKVQVKKDLNNLDRYVFIINE